MTYNNVSQQTLPTPCYFVLFNPTTKKVIQKASFLTQGKISTKHSVCVTTTFENLQTEVTSLSLIGALGEDPTPSV